MRKRIFFFHTVTLISAMVTLLAVNWGVVHWIVGYYQRQATPAANSRSELVHSILEDWDAGARDWSRLDRFLRKSDYNLIVTENGEAVFSSLNQMQRDLYQKVAKDASWPEQGALTVQSDGVVMVGRRSGGDVVVAILRPDVPPVLGRQRPQGEAALLSMLASGATAIGIIVLLSLLFTRYQVKQLMRPVNALAEAAKRVEQGNLSAPVDYQGRDEFSSVCSAFDHMQQHLLSEREKNAAYERARTDLIAGISHDLRTPLTSVKGYIKGMRDGVANTPEKREQYLDIAYRKACDIEQLLQRLFYFSKLETGNLPLRLVPADLGGFARRFAGDAREELAHIGGQVEVSEAADGHPVLLDEEQMYRVLTNLKENALHYAGARPLVLTLTVWREGDRAHLRFADNGHGVPDEQLPHLFEQFWRGDQSRSSRGGEGSGLGLYIVKYIVEAHGGTVQAANDHGLTFEITLPCREDN